MKRILVPISFSMASQNSIRHATSVFSQAQLTLLHVYPAEKYNRKYNFGNKKYASGIKEKIKKFHLKHTKATDQKISIIARAERLSNVIDQISNRYDLMVMSRKVHLSKSSGYFSSKKLFITTLARCPVLIMPITDTPFCFENCEHIWHIKRNEAEVKVVNEGIKKIEINPTKMEVKSPDQKSFLSAFWENIIAYEKSHDKKLIKKIDKAHDEEPIDLIILVDNERSVFTNFFKSDIIHLFCKYDIPILVFPAKKTVTK